MIRISLQIRLKMIKLHPIFPCFLFEGQRLRGGSSLDDMELMVQRKEMSGEANLQRYTPEQYRAMGIEGAYYDANRCINFAPPGDDT